MAMMAGSMCGIVTPIPEGNLLPVAGGFKWFCAIVMGPVLRRTSKTKHLLLMRVILFPKIQCD